MAEAEVKQRKGIKEFFRKIAVSVKRKPQNIPTVAMAITFLYYSLNLTSISNTTAKIQGDNMGLAGFATMLFSILSLVVILNAFPKRQKPNVFMLVVLFVMFGIIILADIVYDMRIMTALTREENRLEITQATIYIYNAYNIVMIHAVLTGIDALLVATLPLYRKLLAKINTSIDVEGNGNLEEIDISQE